MIGGLAKLGFTSPAKQATEILETVTATLTGCQLTQGADSTEIWPKCVENAFKIVVWKKMAAILFKPIYQYTVWFQRNRVILQNI